MSQGGAGPVAQPLRRQSAVHFLRDGNTLIVIGCALLGLLLSYLLTSNPRLIIVLVGGVAALLATFRFPKMVLISLLPLLLVEGAVRKWLLPGLQDVIYFAKDGVLLLLFLHWLLSQLERGRESTARPLPAHVMAPLGLFFVYLLFQVFNPASPNLAFYLFGVRTYLVPLILLVVIPFHLTWAEYEKGMRLLLLAAIPLSALAITQTIVGPEHWLNRYAWGDMNVAVYGNLKEALVRVTSTFSYISGFGAYLTVAALSVAFVFRANISENQILLVAVLGLVIVSTILTGSRFRLLTALLGTPLTFLPHSPRLLSGRALKLVGLILLAGSVATVVFREPIEQFGNRMKRTRDVDTRVSNLWTTPAEAVRIGGITGLGPGTAHQSRRNLMRMTGDVTTLPATPEGEMPRVIVEVGALGGLIWYLFRAMLLFYLVQCFIDAYRRRATDEQVFFAGLVVLSTFLYFGNLIYNATQYYLYAFLIAGVRMIPRAADPTLRPRATPHA